jgi:four helix bundle protein
MQDFHDLKVWQRSHCLTLTVYRVTRSFPKEELYGITSQMRRCSSSIPANIAEGCGRHGKAELARFLQIAMGSASELEYHLLLALDLKLLKEAEHREIVGEVIDLKRMLSAFLKKLRAEG